MFNFFKKRKKIEKTSASYMADYIIEHEKDGIKCDNLAVGDLNSPLIPDLDKAITEVVNNKDILETTHFYGSTQGSIDLRLRINNKHPERVVISNGSKQLIYMGLLSASENKNHVVLIGPCWSSYTKICDILGLKYDLLVGTEEDAYIPTIKQITDVVKKNTCAVIVNTPNNPTGIVYSNKYLEKIQQICSSKDCWLFIDKVYDGYLYDVEWTLPKELMVKRNVLVIDSFSKKYGITGWRVGYAYSNNTEMINNITALQSQISGPPNTLVQKILTSTDLDFKETESYNSILLKARRDLLASQIELFNKFKPDGGFYFYLPIPERYKKDYNTSLKFCEYVLNNYNIALTPGDEYGVPYTVRVVFSNISFDRLNEIVGDLKQIFTEGD